MCRSPMWTSWVVAALTLAAGPLQAQGDEDLAALMAFDSLLQMPLSTASKYAQTTREAAASATVVTSEEIELFGYTTLADVLQHVRGFYTNYDRAYTSLGVRGFGQPGGYNNQVLVLLDGHALNENFYDGARIGTAFPIDLNAVDRVEVVRGPGSALYGSNAVFAVVNVITKTRASLDGLRASGEVGSFSSRRVGITFGRELTPGLELLLSGTWADVPGQNLYFQEFDSPTTNYGVAENVDWHNGHGIMGTLRYGDASLSFMSTARDKANPTAVFRGVFNEEALSADRRRFVEIRVERDLTPTMGLLVRGYYDSFSLDQVYPTLYAGVANAEQSGRWAGVESRLRFDLGASLRVSLGGEFRRNLESTAHAVAPGDPLLWPSVTIDATSQWSVTSLYAQGEFQLLEGLAAIVGARSDNYSNGGNALNPRGGLVYHPGEATTFKLLYGEAFRSPNQWEQVFVVPGWFKYNPNLEPERIRTVELVWDQRILPDLLGTVSLYNYRMDGLIEWAIDLTDGQAFFDNVSRVDARGLEVGLNARLSNSLSASGSYVWQKAQDQDLRVDRPDSPRHQGRIGGVWRSESGLALSASFLYESRRNTLRGFPTDAYVLGEITLTSGRMFDNIGVTLHASNLLDADIRHPAGPEHVQGAIPQNGRAVRVRVEVGY